MPLEIERKFLTSSDAWRQNSVGSTRLRDGLIATNGGKKVRIRIADDLALLTINGPRTGISREEFEYEIPLADGEHLLQSQCDGLIVTKTRHFVLEEDFTFEVDVYEGVLEGIVIAEAELTHIDQRFPRPDWLGEEVTGQERYRKMNMLKDRIAQSVT
jgi:CYTH domain-containing protein